jgi:hypothetical protein
MSAGGWRLLTATSADQQHEDDERRVRERPEQHDAGDFLAAARAS